MVLTQAVFAELLAQTQPRLTERLATMQVPLSLFTLQWFMCLFAKDLPLSLALRVWDVMFVYGDHALFAVGLAMLQMAEPQLMACASLETLYECLKNLGMGLLQRDTEASHRLVLQSLDSLMRTNLVEQIEEARARERRAFLDAMPPDFVPCASRSQQSTPQRIKSTPQAHAQSQSSQSSQSSPPLSPSAPRR